MFLAFIFCLNNISIAQTNFFLAICIKISPSSFIIMPFEFLNNVVHELAEALDYIHHQHIIHSFSRMENKNQLNEKQEKGSLSC